MAPQSALKHRQPDGEIAPSGESSPRLSEQSIRACFRASCRLTLRGLAASIDASGGDVTAAAVMIAILSANVSHLDDDPEQSRRYATYDSPPPDALRRPLSGLAVAKAIGAPRETVRRRLDELTAAGRCVRAPGGFYVPQAVISNREHHAAVQESFLGVRRLRRDLVQLAPDGRWPRRDPATPILGSEADPPYRLINRRLADFAMETLTPLAALTGGWDEALVYMAVVEATGRCQPTGEAPTVAGMAIAQSLKLPCESVRRRLVKLTDRGLLTRARGGFSAVHHPRMDKEVGALALANVRALRRLFADLARHGVELD